MDNLYLNVQLLYQRENIASPLRKIVQCFYGKLLFFWKSHQIHKYIMCAKYEVIFNIGEGGTYKNHRAFKG
jgi:hypothetical protein